MFCGIQQIESKLIVGQYRMVTPTSDPLETAQLFRSFMPTRHDIPHRIDSNTLCVRCFLSPPQWDHADYEYQKWAAVEVSKICESERWRCSEIPGGLYAIFEHRGRADDLRTFNFIFQEWLPNSDYQIDTRPHFDVMPENYHPMDEMAQEWIYVPVIRK